MRAATSRNPAAITVIFTDSFIASSITAPKMMLAFSCAACWMIDDASCTSCSESVDEPVMLIRIPCAPWMQLSSSSGLLMARLAASMARFEPDATAVPITA